MGIIFYILVFICSCLILSFVGNLIINSLLRVARFLKMREFVLAFILMALAASLPNLFVGVSSVLHGAPELSLGDVLGGNVVDLTFAIGLAVLVSRVGLSTNSRTVQASSLFTLFVGFLPVILIADRNLSRIDGLILLGSGILFLFWLFSKREHFILETRQDTDQIGSNVVTGIPWLDLAKLTFGAILLFGAGEGITRSAFAFSHTLGLPLGVIGILVVGFGNALPETYFAVMAARKSQNWMILGDLMGAVIFPATLVLGLVALFSPIENINLAPFVIARIFMCAASIFFFFFVKTGKELTKKEAFLLILLYCFFLAAEIIRLFHI